MYEGYSVERIHKLTKIDNWFLQRLEHIIQWDLKLRQTGGLEHLSHDLLLRAKQLGFSDFQIQRAVWKDSGSSVANIDKVRECQNQFLDKLRSSAPEVIETLAAGKIDDATTQKIETVMADIAGTYKA